jgi:hypothetical protein
MKVVDLDPSKTILQGKDLWCDDLSENWYPVPNELFGKLASQVLPRNVRIRGYDCRLSNAVHPCRWKEVYGIDKP